MEFNEYCVVLIEDDGKIKDELKNISEVSIRCLEEGDFSLCTISTALRLNELEDLLKSHDGNFFIMDLTSEKGVKYNISDEAYRYHLFAELTTPDTEGIKNEENEEEIMNRILDKGKDKMTNKDKKVLKSIMNKRRKDDEK